MAFPVDLRFLRAMRLLRIFRIFKVGRYYDSLALITRVIRSRCEQLVISTFLVLICLIVSASLMYYAENHAQPNAFSSIPASMWWAVVTLTTVGYGDIYPITLSGRILASFISVLGIGLFALPTGILASGFTDEMKSSTEDNSVCPHCGSKIKPE